MIYPYAIVVATIEIFVNEGVPLVSVGFCQMSYKVYKLSNKLCT